MRKPDVVRVTFEPNNWLLMHTDGVSQPRSIPTGSAETAARTLVEEPAPLTTTRRSPRALAGTHVVIHLGQLRIAAPDALPFAREKLRACLVVAGLPMCFAGQVTTVVSQAFRDRFLGS